MVAQKWRPPQGNHATDSNSATRLVLCAEGGVSGFFWLVLEGSPFGTVAPRGRSAVAGSACRPGTDLPCDGSCRLPRGALPDRGDAAAQRAHANCAGHAAGTPGPKRRRRSSASPTSGPITARRGAWTFRCQKHARPRVGEKGQPLLATEALIDVATQAAPQGERSGRAALALVPCSASCWVRSRSCSRSRWLRSWSCWDRQRPFRTPWGTVSADTQSAQRRYPGPRMRPCSPKGQPR
jgi:hypothetical protein